ncbi:DNA cytosine methyltransferase [Gordonia rhizosphera]|uniref:Cytosine-specific methyltransferase n=1 Tax=Gordonia rhizosphera NBRC 16068 TaxID=1108045 RepID=K6V915_9ACTN|nr:DNA (cytosine-5-)-methyltransferase [Gordonia rhizosphera]GAB92713.1 putative modification methylase [Gordonia rhizosphera NBRC 16068]
MGTGQHSGNSRYSVIEICAGAGGQALGLEKAGFDHELAVELDAHACTTLRQNRDWDVRQGDVADKTVWDPAKYAGVSLLAGGVPCPPFSIAGQQLGASDERDLFAWAVEQVATVKPRALMLENVRGLSTPRFAAYRQRILDRLGKLGYEPFWKLLNACDFGVPQLRPRFVLVALRPEDAPYFAWPSQTVASPTVGTALHDLMAADGWRYADAWRNLANDVAPTIVGGSKKHGGADLGPTRAKAAWMSLSVDGKGIADAPPLRTARHPKTNPPRLTIEMVTRLQGWQDDDGWQFSGRKTAQYRQIGNAFPPPVAEAVGTSVFRAFDHAALTESSDLAMAEDELFTLLRRHPEGISESLISQNVPNLAGEYLDKRIAELSLDFEVLCSFVGNERAYRLGNFKGFVGQNDHFRHEYLAENRSKVS